MLNLDRYHTVRQWSRQICQPLQTEDYVIQTMPDVSPPKWHLAHTTWFFETFILQSFLEGYRPFNDRYGYLFNSYYETVGDRHPRPQRGLLARPTVADIYAYRAYVDEFMDKLIYALNDQTLGTEMGNRIEYEAIEGIVILGLHHEQQHQELLLTDIKHIFATNPLFPVYQGEQGQEGTHLHPTVGKISPAQWVSYPDGLYELGHDLGHHLDHESPQEFAFDNESPRHRVYLQPFALADRLVTCGEYLNFIQAGGYHNPAHWLSEGWHRIQTERWQAPLYWHDREGEWWIMTLQGLKPLCLEEPVCHLSYFEADAYATWVGDRLPTEAEWEVGVLKSPKELQQVYYSLWQWTQSAYLPYPGFRAAPGAIGEYNGKFMCNQMVLRGGSCATPLGHVRPTYRNFFPPDARWQFTGLRLARSL